MCKNKKRIRQMLELISALLGLIAALMYWKEVRQSIADTSDKEVE